MSRLFLVPVCLLFLNAGSAPGALAQDCVSGTVTATYNADPAYPGLWRYCVDVTWSLGQYELSHLDVFLQLPDCACICNPAFVRFKPVAGHSFNMDVQPPCEVDYYGSYVCKGDPSLPSGYNGPAVKFDPVPSSCDPGVTGYGTFCFFSPMPPQPAALHPQDLAIKHGQEVCYGPLQGQLPSCDCALPAQPTTWGSVKAVYR